MALSKGFASLLVGASGVVAGSSYIFPFLLGLDKEIVLQAEGANSKELIQLGGEKEKEYLLSQKGFTKLIRLILKINT